MADSAIRELEWFDLETRLREIIYQQFEVFNKKVREDRESHAALSSNVSGIEKRLSVIESCIFGDNSSTSVLSDLQKKISDFEGSRKRDMVRFDQEVVGFKEKLKTVDFQITGTNDMIKRLENIQDGLSKDIQNVNEKNDEHQVMILKEIENIDMHFKELNSNYLDKGIKLEEKMHLTNGKLEEVTLSMGKSERQFEGIKKNLNEIYISLNLLKNNKVEFENFEAERVKTESKLQELSENSQEFRSGLAVRDSFIDKFLPLQTLTLLSDALHFSLEPYAKKRLADFEHIVLKKLHQGALDISSTIPREAAIELILENIKHVEQRKSEILIEKAKEATPLRPVELKPNTSKPVIIQENYKEPYSSKEEISQIFEKYCESKIVPILQKNKSEIFEKFDALKRNITSSENSCMLYTQQVLSELEDFKAKEGKDIGEIQEFLTQMKEESLAADMKLKEIWQVIGGTSQMIVCLVENAQIDLALSAQDEEHRHEVLENVILRPRGQEVMQKKGFLSGQSLMPPKPVPGKVSPLLYRAKRFTRTELVDMKGKMIKMCWDAVCKQIPWRQDEFEYVISEAVKSLKLAPSEDSQHEASQNTLKETLPYVVSPSMRTRTPVGRKFKIAT